MAQRVCQSLGDLGRHGGFIAVRCRCGRAAVASHTGLRTLFVRRGWSTDWRDVAIRLRCDMSKGGCGQRGPRIGFHEGWSPPIPSRLIDAVHVPRGVDLIDWLRADDRGRVRLIRLARG